VENSKIEWTDHTFNPWIGCTKVNTLCEHCYAETMMDKRYKRVQWGPTGTRSRTGEANWRNPVAWNRDAQSENVRRRVFCASLADIYEDRMELYPWRKELFELIDQTQQLDWLTLTKRPENIGPMWAEMDDVDISNLNRRDNVWLGTSVGNQDTADKSVPRLTQWRDLAPVLFLSVEPLLGPIEILPLEGIDWVIVGGESGPGARPMEEEWVLQIQHQCREANVDFFFKQWGGINKKRTGRELKGRTWNAIPEPLTAKAG
jgi:protein gp37